MRFVFLICVVVSATNTSMLNSTNATLTNNTRPVQAPPITSVAYTQTSQQVSTYLPRVVPNPSINFTSGWAPTKLPTHHAKAGSTQIGVQTPTNTTSNSSAQENMPSMLRRQSVNKATPTVQPLKDMPKTKMLFLNLLISIVLIYFVLYHNKSIIAFWRRLKYKNSPLPRNFSMYTGSPPSFILGSRIMPIRRNASGGRLSVNTDTERWLSDSTDETTQYINHSPV